MSQGGPVTGFPAPGLPEQNRYIVGHNPDGQSIFLISDKGDHSSVMVQGAAAQNIPYSTQTNPVDLTDDQDVKFAMENKVLITCSSCLSFPDTYTTSALK